MMATMHRRGDALLVAVKGAPEAVLARRPTACRDDGGSRSTTAGAAAGCSAGEELAITACACWPAPRRRRLDAGAAA